MIGATQFIRRARAGRATMRDRTDELRLVCRRFASLARRAVPTSTARARCFICRVSCHLSPTLALTFRELEAFPRTGLAGLLALLHARIPAEQTLSFQRASEIDIDLEKSTRNRKLRGASLSHDAAAGCVNRQIVGIYRLGSLKRLQHDVL